MFTRFDRPESKVVLEKEKEKSKVFRFAALVTVVLVIGRVKKEVVTPEDENIDKSEFTGQTVTRGSRKKNFAFFVF